MDGAWNEIEHMCVTQNVPITDTTNFKMSSLKGDTYYRIELKAHNAIGFSQPSSLLMRTARGESTNALGSLLYSYGAGSASASVPQQTTAAYQALSLLLSIYFICISLK